MLDDMDNLKFAETSYIPMLEQTFSELFQLDILFRLCKKVRHATILIQSFGPFRYLFIL